MSFSKSAGQVLWIIYIGYAHLLATRNVLIKKIKTFYTWLL